MKYTKLQSKYVEEIQSNITIYSHNKTKARICTIENDDPNKVFSIAFRTPPINNGGLTHILEHSVLCGSKKYPVKDPFVELLKSSLNTFLNAFTFPDKTMYPCASQNDKDFKNLMSVYMDAVFYPQIYDHEEIFMQEGWHYHITDKNEPITYNGVVYNEMKGAFSDPQQVLFRTLMHSLYPDTAYGFESGGDPKFIPDLSYEEFKNFHSKFYHPTNSYIFIYGNCDMKERMDWIDTEYLSKFDLIDFDTKIAYQKPFEKPIYKTEYYQIGKDERINNKAFLSYNVVFPTTLDTKLMIAVDILITALFITPGAVLKQKLIDAKLGEDVDSVFDDGLLQPLLSVMIINSNADSEDKFINIIDTELKEIIKNGLDKKVLESLLNYAEFKERERAFSARMPQGLEIEMKCLGSWLYDDEHPFDKLETLQYFKELKEELNTDYFENILEKYILNNKHKSFVKLLPSYDIKDEDNSLLERKLNDYKESLTEEELDKLIEKNKALQEYQNTPSTKEEIDSLPKLKLNDINPYPEDYNLEVIDSNYKILLSDYYVNDIAYVKYYFDISHIDLNKLLYVNLYSDLFKQLSNNNHSYQEINQLIQNNTGGMNMGLLPFAKLNNEAKLYLTIEYSALTDKCKIANNLLIEILENSNIEDEKRIFERLCELKSNLEMSVVGRGHQVSLTRALSYIDETNKYKDYINGIAYIDFISNLVNNFDKLKNDLFNELKEVKSLLCKDNFILGFTGSQKQLNMIKPILDYFYDRLDDNVSYQRHVFNNDILNEGIKTQFDVNYVARCGKYSQEYNGGIQVLCNCLSMDYLWQQVRVLGGAYGCMMNVDMNGNVGFTSYRDPNIDRTNKKYEEIIDFIENLNPSEEELLKYKIGAIGASEVVLHVRDKAEIARTRYLRDLNYDKLTEIRGQILSVTKEELKNYVYIFKEALAQNAVCVIGNSSKIDSANLQFNNKRSLIK
ncbi:MAG: insulinase family protein [Anaeroplasma sp.]